MSFRAKPRNLPLDGQRGDFSTTLRFARNDIEQKIETGCHSERSRGIFRLIIKGEISSALGGLEMTYYDLVTSQILF